MAAWFGVVIGVRAWIQAHRARIEERSEELYRKASDEQSETNK